MDIFSGSTPITIEAPLIRRYEQLESISEFLTGYGLTRYVDAINIPYHSLGKPTADPGYTALYIKKELSTPVIIHVPLGVENMYTLAGKLIQYALIGVEGLLLLSGDVRLGGISYEEAVDMALGIRDGRLVIDGEEHRVESHSFQLGGAFIPDREGEEERIRFKAGLGLNFFQSQVLTDPEPFLKIFMNGLIPSDRTYLVGVAPHLDSLEKYLSGYIDTSGIDREDYLGWLTSSIGRIIDIARESGYRVGIHIYPISWVDASLEASAELLEALLG